MHGWWAGPPVMESESCGCWRWYLCVCVCLWVCVWSRNKQILTLSLLPVTQESKFSQTMQRCIENLSERKAFRAKKSVRPVACYTSLHMGNNEAADAAGQQRSSGAATRSPMSHLVKSPSSLRFLGACYNLRPWLQNGILLYSIGETPRSQDHACDDLLYSTCCSLQFP